jgi:hypothetical protein
MSDRKSDEREWIAHMLGIEPYPMMQVDEAARALGITSAELKRLAKERRIVHLRISERLIRFDPIDIAFYKDPGALDRAYAARQIADDGERLLRVKTIVYVVQMAKAKHVKIGVARDIAKRLRGLQSGNPERLKVLHTFAGDYTDEKHLHGALTAWRLSGEWFRWGDPVKQAVTLLKDGKTALEVARVLTGSGNA